MWCGFLKKQTNKPSSLPATCQPEKTLHEPKWRIFQTPSCNVQSVYNHFTFNFSGALEEMGRCRITQRGVYYYAIVFRNINAAQHANILDHYLSYSCSSIYIWASFSTVALGLLAWFCFFPWTKQKEERCHSKEGGYRLSALPPSAPVSLRWIKGNGEWNCFFLIPCLQGIHLHCEKSDRYKLVNQFLCSCSNATSLTTHTYTSMQWKWTRPFLKSLLLSYIEMNI